MTALVDQIHVRSPVGTPPHGIRPRLPVQAVGGPRQIFKLQTAVARQWIHQFTVDTQGPIRRLDRTRRHNFQRTPRAGEPPPATSWCGSRRARGRQRPSILPEPQPTRKGSPGQPRTQPPSKSSSSSLTCKPPRQSDSNSAGSCRTNLVPADLLALGRDADRQCWSSFAAF